MPRLRKPLKTQGENFQNKDTVRALGNLEKARASADPLCEASAWCTFLTALDDLDLRRLAGLEGLEIGVSRESGRIASYTIGYGVEAAGNECLVLRPKKAIHDLLQQQAFTVQSLSAVVRLESLAVEIAVAAIGVWFEDGFSKETMNLYPAWRDGNRPGSGFAGMAFDRDDFVMYAPGQGFTDHECRGAFRIVDLLEDSFFSLLRTEVLRPQDRRALDRLLTGTNEHAPTVEDFRQARNAVETPGFISKLSSALETFGEPVAASVVFENVSLADRWEDVTFYPPTAEGLISYRVDEGRVEQVHRDTVGLSRGEWDFLLVLLNGHSLDRVRKYGDDSKPVILSGLRKRLREHFGISDDPLGRKGERPRFRISTGAEVYLQNGETLTEH